MRLEDDITETATRICDQLASAVERYAAISGLGFSDIPETFLRDRVFDGLGDVLTMTLETKNSTLWEWNADNRRRASGQPLGTPAPTQPDEYKNCKRPDLVIFTGDHTKKSETNFLCLVEIKKWWMTGPSDQAKIDEWFQWLDCPYGMLCALVELPNDTFIDALRTEAFNANHHWVSGRIARPLGIAKRYQPFARIVPNKYFRPTNC